MTRSKTIEPIISKATKTPRAKKATNTAKKATNTIRAKQSTRFTNTIVRYEDENKPLVESFIRSVNHIVRKKLTTGIVDCCKHGEVEISQKLYDYLKRTYNFNYQYQVTEQFLNDFFIIERRMHSATSYAMISHRSFKVKISGRNSFTYLGEDLTEYKSEANKPVFKFEFTKQNRNTNI